MMTTTLSFPEAVAFIEKAISVPISLRYAESVTATDATYMESKMQQEVEEMMRNPSQAAARNGELEEASFWSLPMEVFVGCATTPSRPTSSSWFALGALIQNRIASPTTLRNTAGSLQSKRSPSLAVLLDPTKSFSTLRPSIFAADTTS